MRKFKEPTYLYDSYNALSDQVVVAGHAISEINNMEKFRGSQAATRVRVSILTGLAEALDRPTTKGGK